MNGSVQGSYRAKQKSVKLKIKNWPRPLFNSKKLTDQFFSKFLASGLVGGFRDCLEPSKNEAPLNDRIKMTDSGF